MKPPMVYFGAKMTVADEIVSMFPEHDGYIEPFGGSLAVLLAKPVERMEVVNDLSKDLVWANRPPSAQMVFDFGGVT